MSSQIGQNHSAEVEVSGMVNQHPTTSYTYLTLQPSLGAWGQALNTKEATVVLQRDLNQIVLDLHAVAFTCIHTCLCDFVESHFPDEKMKLLKRMGDHLMDLHRLASLQAQLGECLFERPFLKPENWEPPEPSHPEGCSAFPPVCLLPEPFPFSQSQLSHTLQPSHKPSNKCRQ